MDPTTLRKVLIPVLGTVFGIVTGLMTSLVVLRTLELFGVVVGPARLFAIVVFGAFVCSLYTSTCVRVELDLAVILLGVSVGALAYFVMPRETVDVGAVVLAMLVTSLANSAFGSLIDERFRWIDARFIETVHAVQLVFLCAQIAWSFEDMTIRAALAVHGVIAALSWHRLFQGTCALTLIEAKLDVDGEKQDLVDRGYILYYLERMFGIRPSASTYNLFVGSTALAIYSYWLVDLLR